MSITETATSPGFNYKPDIAASAENARRYEADPNMKALWMSRLELFEALDRAQTEGGRDAA